MMQQFPAFNLEDKVLFQGVLLGKRNHLLYRSCYGIVGRIRGGVTVRLLEVS